MKEMTCEQLGGACDKVFRGESFDDVVEQSKHHAREMLEKDDKAHIQAMEEMKERMKSPPVFNEWMYNKRKEFDGLPEVSGERE